MTFPNHINSPVIKRSVSIAGHATSVSLEQPFWDALGDIAMAQGKSVPQLIIEVDKTREGNLSSSLRLYVLYWLQTNGRTTPAKP